MYSSTARIPHPQFFRFNWHRTDMENRKPSNFGRSAASRARPMVSCFLTKKNSRLRKVQSAPFFHGNAPLSAASFRGPLSFAEPVSQVRRLCCFERRVAVFFLIIAGRRRCYSATRASCRHLRASTEVPVAVAFMTAARPVPHFDGLTWRSLELVIAVKGYRYRFPLPPPPPRRTRTLF